MKILYEEVRLYQWYCPDCDQLVADTEDPGLYMKEPLSCQDCGRNFGKDEFYQKE